MRCPGSHPRSSNRSPFRASGFPTGFIVDSRTRGPWPLKPKHPQGSIHPFRRELAGALRRHLVPPSQKVPYPIINVLVHRPMRPTRAPYAEVLPPALQLPIQLATNLLPGRPVLAIQQFSHLLLDPAHALVRRTVSDVPAAAARVDVRPECIPQKIESLLPGIPNARLLLVERQLQPLQHSTRPIQGFLRLSATLNHEVSSPGESHPEALSEPYLNLSAHTAPTMEPRRTPICQCANSFGSRREMRATQCAALRR